MVMISPLRSLGEIKDLVMLDQFLPECRGKEFTDIGKFVQGEFEEHSLLRLCDNHHRATSVHG
jgi:hypothetical protein